MSRPFFDSEKIRLAFGFACALMAAGVHAANWTGNGATQDWTDPANWNPAAVPGVTQVDINAGTSEAYPAVIGADVEANPTTLNIGTGSNTSGYLLVDEGTLNVSGGTVIGKSTIAGVNNGYGRLVNKGGNLTLREVRIGVSDGVSNPFGSGELIHDSGSLIISNIFYFGIGGNAHLKADANFTVLGATHFGFRGNKEGPAYQLMELGPMTASFKSVLIGNSANVNGKIILRGTTLESTELRVRNNASATGVISGWGKIHGGTLYNNGKIIADGENVARDLDLRYYHTAANLGSTTMRDGSGWYAINKGRILFTAHSFYANQYLVGDRSQNYTLILANCARITVSGLQTGNWNCFLLAPDHPDVPKIGFALKSVKSIWNFESPAFTSASVTFRYDETAVRDTTLLRMLRYNPENGMWERVATTYDAINLHFTASDLAPKGETNLGFFALVELPPPTLLFVR